MIIFKNSLIFCSFFIKGGKESSQSTSDSTELATKKLNEFLPKLEKSSKAIQSIDKKDLAELKSFKMPPSGVRMASEAVCILFAVNPSYENFKKLLLSDSAFIQKVLNYDKNSISDYSHQELTKYVVNPEFQPQQIKNQSNVASALSEWVLCMYEYKTLNAEIEVIQSSNSSDIKTLISSSFYPFYWPNFFEAVKINNSEDHKTMWKLAEAVEKINFKKEKFMSVDDFLDAVDGNSAIKSIKEQANKILLGFAEKHVRSEAANVNGFLFLIEIIKEYKIEVFKIILKGVFYLNQNVDSKYVITDIDWFASVLSLLATHPDGNQKKQAKRLSQCFAEKLPIWPKEALKEALKPLISEQKVFILSSEMSIKKKIYYTVTIFVIKIDNLIGHIKDLGLLIETGQDMIVSVFMLNEDNNKNLVYFISVNKKFNNIYTVKLTLKGR
jgi:hypothetical protein